MNLNASESKITPTVRCRLLICIQGKFQTPYFTLKGNLGCYRVLLKGMQDQISDWKSQLLAKENDTAISETKVSQLAIDFQAS